MEKARDFMLKVFRLLSKPELRILPGQLAFFIVLTIIPLVALIATLAAALSISTDSIGLALAETLPDEVVKIIHSITASGGINFNIIVFYFSAFLLASNGTYSMINTSNEIYKVEPRNVISRRTKAVVMTFILVGLFLFLIFVPVFGSTVFEIIKESTGRVELATYTQKIIAILKYPLIILILFLNIKLMYTLGPDKEIPAKTTNKGSIFTTVGWILSTEIFAFYVEKFAKYDLFYGSISNILVLLLWVYLLSYIYVVGMIINASDYRGELDERT